MPRRPRIEIEGGLYHVMTRGNNRQRIFRSDKDYSRMLALIGLQKSRLPFYLYAYCLMPNHLHLLIERREDAISNIMHRLLTAYSHYYNRSYRQTGHVLQGRYRTILCDSDMYLGELVRYIHLNPVRAGLVQRPEDYEYSGHREYLERGGWNLVDIDPLLRCFGSHKARAMGAYKGFVDAGMKLDHQTEFYELNETVLLGTKEFVSETIHRIGKIPQAARPQPWQPTNGALKLGTDRIAKAVERVTGLTRNELIRRTKISTNAKEAAILAAIRLGVSRKELCRVLSLSNASLGRRLLAARLKLANQVDFRSLVKRLQSELIKRS